MIQMISRRGERWGVFTGKHYVPSFSQNYEPDADYLCPACREELGMKNLLGFDQ
jgi:hypothetical protein